MNLIPAFGEPCPDDGLDELNAKIASLGIALAQGDITGSADVGCKYYLGDNKIDLESVAFRFEGDKLIFTPGFVKPENPWDRDATEYNRDIVLSYNDWTESGEEDNMLAGSYAWLPDGKLQLKIVQVYTPFIITFTVEFLQKAIKAEYSVNVGFGNKPARLVGVSVNESSAV